MFIHLVSSVLQFIISYKEACYYTDIYWHCKNLAAHGYIVAKD